jgi:hypothetical protein
MAVDVDIYASHTHGPPRWEVSWHGQYVGAIENPDQRFGLPSSEYFAVPPPRAPEESHSPPDLENPSVEGLTDEQVIALIPALAEAARANESTLDRFVAPRTGIVEEAAARRHQFVLGRRGVGKSSLLRKVQKDLGDRETGIAVFIDLETYRGVPYPDVLIQLLMELFTALDDAIVDRSRRHPIRRLRLRRSRTRLTKEDASLRNQSTEAKFIRTKMDALF